MCKHTCIYLLLAKEEHTCCKHTLPAHGSSHHGWRIIYTQCRLTAAHTTGGECTMPAHGSSHHGWRMLYTHNAGSRQLTPRAENKLHTMPAHGSSHHRWRIIYTQCRLMAAHTAAHHARWKMCRVLACLGSRMTISAVHVTLVVHML